jgi:hypothetical protein
MLARQRPAGQGVRALVAAIDGSELARRVAEQTCDWMIADLLTAEGGFAGAGC